MCQVAPIQPQGGGVGGGGLLHHPLGGGGGPGGKQPLNQNNHNNNNNNNNNHHHRHNNNNNSTDGGSTGSGNDVIQPLTGPFARLQRNVRNMASSIVSSSVGSWGEKMSIMSSMPGDEWHDWRGGGGSQAPYGDTMGYPPAGSTAATNLNEGVTGYYGGRRRTQVRSSIAESLASALFDGVDMMEDMENSYPPRSPRGPRRSSNNNSPQHLLSLTGTLNPMDGTFIKQQQGTSSPTSEETPAIVPRVIRPVKPGPAGKVTIAASTTMIPKLDPNATTTSSIGTTTSPPSSPPKTRSLCVVPPPERKGDPPAETPLNRTI